MQNFRESYEKLIKSGGAGLVADANALVNAIGRLLTDKPRRDSMADAALRTVSTMQGSLLRTRQALEPHIAPLILKARLEPQKPKKL